MQKILYFDSNPKRIRMIRSTLGNSFDVTVAGSFMDFALMLRDNNPDALLFYFSPKNVKSIISCLESIERRLAPPPFPEEGEAPFCAFFFHEASSKNLASQTADLVPFEPLRANAIRELLHCDIFSIRLPIQASTIEAIQSALDRSISASLLQVEQSPHTETTKMGHISLIGASAKIRRLISQIRSHAKTSSPVLIVGETGTGKELTARALHSWSSRSTGPFIALNCSAIPEPLFESEIFGTERGAYTDAPSRTGAIEAAHTGTLFLDEIGSLSPILQPRLLRVLETGEYRRLGSTTQHSSIFRLVSASCLNPVDLAAENKFRKDLLFRIANVVIEIPPLRERIEDIPLLARHFCARFSKDKSTLDSSALEKLAAHDWPGNVRELKAVIARACAVCKDRTIRADDIEFLAGISKLSTGTR